MTRYKIGAGTTGDAMKTISAANQKILLFSSLMPMAVKTIINEIIWYAEGCCSKIDLFSFNYSPGKIEQENFLEVERRRKFIFSKCYACLHNNDFLKELI